MTHTDRSYQVEYAFFDWACCWAIIDRGRLYKDMTGFSKVAKAMCCDDEDDSQVVSAGRECIGKGTVEGIALVRKLWNPDVDFV